MRARASRDTAKGMRRYSRSTRAFAGSEAKLAGPAREARQRFVIPSTGPQKRFFYRLTRFARSRLANGIGGTVTNAGRLSRSLKCCSAYSKPN